jgi:hypothetical protein
MLAEAIAIDIVCVSTIHNTYQLPINIVYLGSAITFPQNQKLAYKEYVESMEQKN